MLYDLWNPYDPDPDDSAADRARLRKRLKHDQRAVRAMLPDLRREIENPQRDTNSVHEALRPYFDDGRDVPLAPADLPELEALYRLAARWPWTGAGCARTRFNECSCVWWGPRQTRRRCRSSWRRCTIRGAATTLAPNVGSWCYGAWPASPASTT
ncbi:MAG: hypothetical protein KKA73_20510 [Chloroflexi bacterium]|nr:hypothetical protein [Chloroflexota bacterium]MBU1750073.1 hypothetical protein [Chloroflexota bacterium]